MSRTSDRTLILRSTLTGGTLALAAGLCLALGANIAIQVPRYALDLPVETLQRSAMPLTVRAPGELQAKRSFAFKAPFDARVLSKNFEAGKPAKTGQMLLELSTEHLEQEYETRRIALQNAESDRRAAIKELRLQKTLFQKQAVAESAVSEAERTLVRAEQSLVLARTGLADEERLRSLSRVTAPFDGLILSDGIGTDKEVTSGRDLLALADVSEYRAVVRVDELDIGKVRPGQKAELHVQAFDDHTLPAVVESVGAQMVEGSANEFPVTLRVTDSQGLALLPKLTLTARIEVGHTAPILSVPLSAIDNADGKPKVWVVNRGSAQARPVTLGSANQERIEVVQGLSAGDQICQKTDRRLVEGRRIHVHD